MKYIILIGLVYLVYKFNTWRSMLGSVTSNDNSKINNHGSDDDEGEYVDYEEVTN